jgi:hypothetical protein
MKLKNLFSLLSLLSLLLLHPSNTMGSLAGTESQKEESDLLIILRIYELRLCSLQISGVLVVYSNIPEDLSHGNCSLRILTKSGVSVSVSVILSSSGQFPSDGNPLKVAPGEYFAQLEARVGNNVNIIAISNLCEVELCGGAPPSPPSVGPPPPQGPPPPPTNGGPPFPMPNYILAASAITNTGPTRVDCNLGVSPGSTSPTGFPPGVYTGSIHLNDAPAINARNQFVSNRAWCRGLPPGTSVNSNLAGMTLTPGVYTSPTTMFVSGAPLRLDAQGNSNGIFVFQVGSALTVDGGGSVLLQNGANGDNVYWCEGTAATIGVNSSFIGHLLAGSAVTVDQNAIVTGRIFSDTTAISLDTSTINCGGP